ncbi:UNVERIFIED_CONTAM: hypothetical protein RMT77_005483 [Armadillidium vulgare]
MKNNRFIHPEILFRRFTKLFEKEAISWPVNLELMIAGENIPIKNKEFEKLTSLNVGENEVSHLFFVNQCSSSRSSLLMEEASYKLLKIFEKSIFKFEVILEDDHHIKKDLREEINIATLELDLRRLKWWKLTFKNIGIKNKYQHKWLNRKKKNTRNKKLLQRR